MGEAQRQRRQRDSPPQAQGSGAIPPSFLPADRAGPVRNGVQDLEPKLRVRTPGTSPRRSPSSRTRAILGPVFPEKRPKWEMGALAGSGRQRRRRGLGAGQRPTLIRTSLGFQVPSVVLGLGGTQTRPGFFARLCGLGQSQPFLSLSISCNKGPLISSPWVVRSFKT